jgi:hypothetical protein
MILMVQHRVRDFDAWKPVFDEHEHVRAGHHCSGHLLYRQSDDSRQVTVIMQYPSRADAEAFASDPSLKEAMQKGGVEGEPSLTWLDEVEAADYAKRRAA